MCAKNYRRWPFASLLAMRGTIPSNLPECCNPLAQGARLCLALLRGDNGEAEGLLRNGARADYQDEPNGWTPLIYAIYYDNPGGRKLLFQYGASAKLADYSGRTPLMFAAMNGNEELLLELLTRGADAFCRDARGRTACDYAVLYRHHLCSAELLRQTGGGEENAQEEEGEYHV